jgi:hypothetical protein
MRNEWGSRFGERASERSKLKGGPAPYVPPAL